MKTIETTVCEFAELSESAKDKAREWYRDGALDYDWWESTYEDAGRIGLEITGFGLDRDRHATGKFIKDVETVARLILKEHGESCETFKTATSFLKEYSAVEVAIDDVLSRELDEEREELANEFRRSLLEDYSIILQHEMEWLLSNESVDETITANEYTFTEEGKRFG